VPVHGLGAQCGGAGQAQEGAGGHDDDEAVARIGGARDDARLQHAEGELHGDARLARGQARGPRAGAAQARHAVGGHLGEGQLGQEAGGEGLLEALGEGGGDELVHLGGGALHVDAHGPGAVAHGAHVHEARLFLFPDPEGGGGERAGLEGQGVGEGAEDRRQLEPQGARGLGAHLEAALAGRGGRKAHVGDGGAGHKPRPADGGAQGRRGLGLGAGIVEGGLQLGLEQARPHEHGGLGGPAGGEGLGVQAQQARPVLGERVHGLAGAGHEAKGEQGQGALHGLTLSSPLCKSSSWKMAMNAGNRPRETTRQARMPRAVVRPR
jgi:hypothetical protein